jgi:hypothetical protein
MFSAALPGVGAFPPSHAAGPERGWVVLTSKAGIIDPTGKVAFAGSQPPDGDWSKFTGDLARASPTKVTPFPNSSATGSAMALPFLRAIGSAIYVAKTELSQKIQIVADMIRISCAGICGAYNFRCR